MYQGNEFNLDRLSLRGPTSAEDIQQTSNLKLGREMKQSPGGNKI